MSNFYVPQGTNAVENAKELMELLISQLQEKHKELSEHYSYFGKGFEKSLRPWALVFCKDIQDIETLFDREENEAEQRIWLDRIRICRVETAHQLRAMLCGIHIQPRNDSERVGVLKWMEQEMDGQPPSLVVVIDIFDLLLKPGDENLRYLSLNFNELSHLLLNLVETCAYLSTRNQRRWEDTLGDRIEIPTRLVITDGGRIPKEEMLTEVSEVGFINKLNNVITYYMDNIL